MKLFVLLLGLSFFIISDRCSGSTLGESIYHKGIGRDGRQINAALPGGVNLQGEAVACEGCHGENGHGGGESFINAPNIRWSNLSRHLQKPEQNNNQNYYDKTLFARAVNQGIKAGGQPIDPIMPRFDFATDEIEALINFLSDKHGPKDHVAVALTLLPETGMSQFADSLALNIQSCRSSAPGTHTWPLEIIRFKSFEDANAKLQNRLASGSVKLIVAPFIIGWEQDYLTVTSYFQIPTLLPYTPLDLPQNTTVYLAFPGLQSQLKALIDEAVKLKIKRLISIASNEDKLAASLFRQISDYADDKAIDLQLVSNNETPQLEKQTDALLVISPLPAVKAMMNRIKTVENTQVFIPAIYFQPPSKNAYRWLIAYPYPPKNSALQNKWESPLSKWSASVCSILALTADQPETSWWKTYQGSSSAKGDSTTKRHFEHLETVSVLPWK